MTTLQADTDVLIESLRSSLEASKSFRDEIPADGALYPEQAGALRTARAGYKDAHSEYASQLETLVDALGLKRANPFQNPSLAVGFSLSAPSVADVEGLAKKHSDKSAAHDKEVAAAARRVELALVQEFRQEYEDKRADVAAKQKLAEALEAEAGRLNQQIVALQSVGADPVPSADELTKNVARLLGRADLKFSATPDGKHYLIERDGKPAKNLSEGERTASSLLHFLIGIRKEATPGDEPIVVVDDPVSSIDDGILFGASSYLWSELVTSTFASQVFLLTHNFELFRQWIVALENAGTRVDGGYTIHEVRARYRDDRGQLRRVPQMDPWTDNDALSRRCVRSTTSCPPGSRVR